MNDRNIRRGAGRAIGVACASMALLTSTGCLLNPGNDKNVCGADADISFSGYVTAASTPIDLQVSSGPSVLFTTVATANSAASAITVTGESYYAFSGSATVEQWQSTPSGLTLRVRARTGSFNLITFEEQNAQGQNGISCILDGIAGGQTASQAALDCDRNDAVIEIRAPLLSTCGCTPFAAPGDLIIDSARSAALAQCVTSVGGDLRVLPGAPDLVSLAQLTSIGGDAELHYDLVDASNGSFRNREIDLSSLTSIAGNVDMTTRRGFSEPKTIDTQTGAVTFIGGNVTISTYDNNVQAFGAVTSVAGSITLQGFNGPSSNLDIFGGQTFPSLTSVGGDLTVQGFFACNGVFTSVTSVDGDVRVRAVRLAPQQSFNSLATVGGDLIFQEMKQFGPPWPSIASVGQNLQLIDNGTLTQLSAVPVGTISVDGVIIDGQPNLTALNGTFQAGAGDITIANNTSLSQCEADTWLAAQVSGGWTGTDSVSDTVPCP